MQNIKNKALALLITALMVVSIGATVMLPTTSAATTIPTFAYVAALPNHVGIGDSITIYMWIDKIAPGADMENDYRVHNYKLTITLPDNTTTLLRHGIQLLTQPQTKPTSTPQHRPEHTQ